MTFYISPLLASITIVSLICAHIYGLRRDSQALFITFFFDLVVGGLILLALLNHTFFKALMQEDACVEWATFYAFMGAGLVTLFWLRRHWFELINNNYLTLVATLGVALFCILVAAEEISWGQRLFAFKPPNLFLEMNYQQELNIHNLFKKKEFVGIPLDSRFLVAFIAIIYGLVLVALARFIKHGRFADAITAVAPPITLVPWFILIAYVELTYPVKLAGEAAEFVLGLLFLVAALTRDTQLVSQQGKRPSYIKIQSGLLIPLVLGLLTPSVLQATLYSRNNEYVAQTQTELEELRQDILQDSVITKRLLKMRSIHKRLYTAVRKGYISPPASSVFLQSQGALVQFGGNVNFPLRKDRRDYFLDPWNNPYWIHYSRQVKRITVYSFGQTKLSARYHEIWGLLFE